MPKPASALSYPVRHFQPQNRLQDRLLNQMQERFSRKGTLSGVTTGFHWLDKMTDGLQHREMALIAARPSIGKTAIAIAIAVSRSGQSQSPDAFHLSGDV